MTETATVTFTIGDVANEVRRLAEAAPDFVYRPEGYDEDTDYLSGGSCSYLTGLDGKGCIVGQALSNLGVDDFTLTDVEYQHALHALARVGVIEHSDQFNEDSPLPVEALWILSVQENQDAANTWGEAVARADEKHYPSEEN